MENIHQGFPMGLHGLLCSIPMKFFSCLQYNNIMPRRKAPSYRGRATGRASTQKRVRAANRRHDARKRPAIKAALSLKETKKHQVTNTAGLSLWNNTNKWTVFMPLALGRSSTDSSTQRESNIIYALNYRIKMDLEPHPEALDPFYVRYVVGWAKGSSNYGGDKTALECAQASHLNEYVTNWYADFDKDDYKIISDKSIRYCPRQIFDSTSGDGTLESTGLQNDNRALWSNIKRNFNFKFNRKYHYEGSQESELVGWVPFIAVMIDRTIHGSAFTGTSGSTPSPHLTYESTMYFKDIV